MKLKIKFKSAKILILIVFLILSTVSFLVSGRLSERINYGLYVVESASMHPVIKKWSLIIIEKRSSYNLGDIIVFASPININETITHRIKSESYDNGYYFITKGDANNTEDPWQLRMDRIIGSEILTIPYLGYIINLIQSEVGLVLFLIIPIIVLVYKDFELLLKIVSHQINKFKRLIRKLMIRFYKWKV